MLLRASGGRQCFEVQQIGWQSCRLIKQPGKAFSPPSPAFNNTTYIGSHIIFDENTTKIGTFGDFPNIQILAAEHDCVASRRKSKAASRRGWARIQRERWLERRRHLTELDAANADGSAGQGCRSALSRGWRRAINCTIAERIHEARLEVAYPARSRSILRKSEW